MHTPPQGALIAVDFGKKRIGLAVTDAERRFQFPCEPLAATGRPAADALALARFAREKSASAIVVGLPLNMDGSVGPQAHATRAFIAALIEAAGLPVYEFDERLTSFQADEWLAEQGVAKAARKRDPRRDSLAALAILRGFLSGESNDQTTPRLPE